MSLITTKNANKLLFMSLSLLVLFTSCVSLKIKGSNPVQRAQSAARLLVEGNVSDAYIKQYNKEMSLALTDIEDKLIRIETNPEAYEAIADNIRDWINLYDEIYVLEKNYPQGLFGKKQSTYFEYIDYRPLQEKAAKLACESQFQKAQDLLSRSYSFSDKILVLDHLKKAKSYSSHLDEEINPIGAQINYEEAERLFTSTSSLDLKESMTLYTASSLWISNYKDSNSKALEAKEKASKAMIIEGDAEIRKQNYAAFRKAYALFQEAKDFGNTDADNRVAKTETLLTVKLGILYSGKDSYYSDEQIVKSAISREIEKNSRGPMFVETSFVYMPSSTSIFELFMNTFTAVLDVLTTGTTDLSLQNYDIVAYPGEAFNSVRENIAKPVREIEIIEKYFSETRIKEPGKQDQVTVKEVTEFEYKNPRPSEKGDTQEILIKYWIETGKVTKDIQVVELWRDNSYELYDVRNSRRDYLGKLERVTDKITYEFIKSAYSGSDAARPKILSMDDFYSPGSYREFGLKVPEFQNPYQIVSASGYSLNAAGKIICNKIEQMEYRP